MNTAVVRCGARLCVLTRMIASGGEADVFEFRWGFLAKLPHDPAADYKDRITHLMNHRPSPLYERGRLAFAVPEEPLLDPNSGQVMGYVMEQAPGRTLTEAVLAGHIAAISDRFRLRVARSIAWRTHVLHQAGYIRGDLQPGNEIVTRNGHVTSIDLDSMAFDAAGRHFPAPVAVPNYLAPELLNAHLPSIRRERSSDYHSLAVLELEILTDANPFDVDPKDPRAPAPDLLGCIEQGWWCGNPAAPVVAPRGAKPFVTLDPAIQQLAYQALTRGHADPQARPTALDWFLALDRAAGQARGRRTISRSAWQGAVDTPATRKRRARLQAAAACGAAAVMTAVGTGFLLANLAEDAARPARHLAPLAAAPPTTLPDGAHLDGTPPERARLATPVLWMQLQEHHAQPHYATNPLKP